MNSADFKMNPPEELVQSYSRAALEHGLGTEAGDANRANAAYDTIAAIYRELRLREKQSLLLPLLSSPEPWIRHWAAAHTLESAAEHAVPVLEALGKQGRVVGLDSKMTLREWRAGRLRFP